MNITAISNNTPIKNNTIISSKISENPIEQDKEITQLPSLKFCAACASNIKMPTFDAIAEKSSYNILRDVLNIDKDVDKKSQYKESLVTVSDGFTNRIDADFYTQTTKYRDGSILVEQISNKSNDFDRETRKTTVNDDIGKYQTMWYKDVDGKVMYVKLMDNEIKEILFNDNKDKSIWHYRNVDTDVDVAIDTKKLNKMGISNDKIFKQVTDFEEEASYGRSLRSYRAVNLAKGIEV